MSRFDRQQAGTAENRIEFPVGYRWIEKVNSLDMNG
jgi:hypothetical protein